MHRITALMIVAASLAVAAPAQAGWLEAMAGHISIGYGKLFADEAPGGSLSIAGGLDVPMSSTVRTGIEIGFDLLGTRSEEEGTLIAEVDYSAVEAIALVHWTPPFRGPLGRISAGPGFFSARGDLSSSGGAAFSDLAVDEVAPGMAIALTFIQRRPAPVRVGFEAGTRVMWLEDQTWTVASGRLVFHY